jgi:hypothetical protein
MCEIFWTEFVCKIHHGLYDQRFIHTICDKALAGAGWTGSCGEIKEGDAVDATTTCPVCTEKEYKDLNDKKSG